MITQAKVRGGRLVLDEPTSLPEGATVDVIVVDDAVEGMADDEREALLASLDIGLAQAGRGETIGADDALRRLRAT